jgi:hypothetical protein
MLWSARQQSLSSGGCPGRAAQPEPESRTQSLTNDYHDVVVVSSGLFVSEHMLTSLATTGCLGAWNYGFINLTSNRERNKTDIGAAMVRQGKCHIPAAQNSKATEIYVRRLVRANVQNS